MKCLNCGKVFIVKRKLNTILNLKDEVVCDECLKRYPIKINFSSIPLSNYNLEIIYLFERKNFNFLIYEEALEKLFNEVKKTRKEALVFKENYLKLNDKKISEYEGLANKEKRNIIILTFYLQIDW